MGYKWIEMSNHGFGMNVYWDAPYGSTSAYVYWDLDYNDYGRTFNLYRRGEGTRYNSGSTVPFDEYCIYVYKNGSYATQSEWFTIEADAPPTRYVYYNANGRGAAPSTQSVVSGNSLTLRSKIANQSGTTYTVSFNANGGSTTPSSLSSTYTYTQTNWNTNSSGTGTNYTPGGTYTINSDMTLYAVWSGSRKAVTLPAAISRANGSAKRTVTFNANGGTCNTASLDSTATITYTFNGWSTSSSATSGSAAGSSYTPSANTTMYATWASSTGSYSSITLPTPTRDGYTFNGWSTSSSATSGTTGSYTPTGNVTLYATWAQKSYTITYNNNGKGSTPASQTKTHGTNLTLQSFIADQTASGYSVTFNENGGDSRPNALTSTLTYKQTYWNTASNGSGTNYASKGTYSANESATLYAIWNTTYGSVTLPAAITKANTSETGYKVTFNANGGSCSTTELTSSKTRKYTFSKWAAGSTSGTQYSAGASYSPTGATTMYAIWSETVTNGSITLPTPTRTGYTFKGWSTSSSATSGTAAGQSYTPTAATTLYATWQINTWTINYNANGYGSAPSSQTKTYGTTLTLRSFIADQSSAGYTVSFNSNNGTTTPTNLSSTITRKQTYWNTKSNGTGTNYGSGGSYTANEGATLYAIWSTTNGSVTLPSAITRNNTTENGYKVTFNANGGTCNTPSLTAVNTRSYTFNKWAAGSTSGTKYNAGASFTPTANTTMYATWTESVTNGTIELPVAAKSGYTFIGWGTSSSATTGTTGEYTPTRNITLYAVYSANGYAVTYDSNGHGTAPANQVKTHGVTLTLQPFIADHTETGYTVSLDANGGSVGAASLTSEISYKQTSWNTKANGSGTSYASRGNYTENTEVTLYAIWEITKQTVTLPTPVRNGYTFVGWGTRASSSSGVTGEYTPSSNVTLYAIWQQSNSRIHYNNNGVDVLCDVYYNNNGTAVLCNVYYNNNGVETKI